MLTISSFSFLVFFLMSSWSMKKNMSFSWLLFLLLGWDMFVIKCIWISNLVYVLCLYMFCEGEFCSLHENCSTQEQKWINWCYGWLRAGDRWKMSSIVKGIFIRSRGDDISNMIWNAKKKYVEHSDVVVVGGRRSTKSNSFRAWKRGRRSYQSLIRGQAILTPATPPTTKKVRLTVYS